MKKVTYKREKKPYFGISYNVYCDSIKIGYIKKDNIYNVWFFWMDTGKSDYRYDDGFEELAGGHTLKETKQNLEAEISKGYFYGKDGDKINLSDHFPSLEF